ncbi:MAG: sulfate ABC transporter substrate-binding protein [Rubellimicrobium sp.]|nr:sulfate ABC transporter substrate-binding protein [Rubellimicrobium sp.]
MTHSLTRAAAVALVLGVGGAAGPATAQDTLLNVSYDIARELFEALNPAFAAHWRETTGNSVTVDQSHGGSSAQARAILEGLAADVVTFNQETDIDVLAADGLVPESWRELLPNGASPWYSLPAFLVREGNPRGIHDWDDLARDDVAVIFPNPRTSGNARYTYLAAFAFALDQNGGDEDAAEAFVRAIFDNVPVFDTGGRGATQTFAERGIGDVLVTFEAETGGIAAAYADQGLERVTPSLSLFAAFPVAVVAEVADRNGTTELANAYLDWLYSPEAQRIVAGHYYRVTDEGVAAEFADSLPEVRLVTVDEVFGGWDAVRANHFAEGARLDNVFVNQ